jgi:hypothetical protein
VSEPVHAPFNPDEVTALRQWQADDLVHPYACCNGVRMEVRPFGLICPRCERVQTWAHAFTAQPLPQRYRCRRCGGVFARSDCARRYGILECPNCLPEAWVDLLEPVLEVVS